MAEIEFNNISEAKESPPNYSESKLESQSPPDYSSLFSKLKKAKTDSSNPVQFVSKSSAILCGSAAITFVLLISSAIPITCIVIGALKINSCTIEPHIPIWLIVTGVCGTFTALVKALTNIVHIIKKRESEEKQGGFLALLNCISGLVGLFTFGWFIAGNVWVYSNYHRVNYDFPYSAQYCDKLGYLFAFWVITGSYIACAFACCCLCFLCFCAFGMMACYAKSAK